MDKDERIDFRKSSPELEKWLMDWRKRRASRVANELIFKALRDGYLVFKHDAEVTLMAEEDCV